MRCAITNRRSSERITMIRRRRRRRDVPCQNAETQLKIDELRVVNRTAGGMLTWSETNSSKDKKTEDGDLGLAAVH
jgi:hypothetical protein